MNMEYVNKEAWSRDIVLWWERGRESYVSAAAREGSLGNSQARARITVLPVLWAR